MLVPKRTVDLRRLNHTVLLRHVYLHGPMSRLELSQQTDLSPSTVTNVITTLLQDGILLETGATKSLGGRPRAILDVNAHYGYLIGVDLDETHVQLVLFDLSRRKLKATYDAVDPGARTPEPHIAIIARRVNELIADLPREKVLGIGVGAPGIVEPHHPQAGAAPTWEWRSEPLAERIAQAVDLPVFVNNGAKAMALAEAWYGVGRGAQDIIVVLLGSTVGAGIVTQGRLFRGSANGAGEWGHTKISLDGRVCRCGGKGCLEAYLSAPGLIASWREISGNGSAPVDGDQVAVLERLILAYRKGDAAAKQVLRETVRVLSAGIANLVNLFNPERVIIGGWVGLQIGEVILEDVIEGVKAQALPATQASLLIGLSQFRQDAICTGAACLVLDEFLSLSQEFSTTEQELPR